jgi:hypothetical protein
MKKKEMTLTEAQLKEARKIQASSGGKSCLKKHGKDYYKKMAINRWKKAKESKVELSTGQVLQLDA